MFAQFFIGRPVFAAVIAFVTVLVGGLALTSLPIAQYPEVVPPQVVVTATYPGASAQTVSDTVASPIEEQVNGVEDMLYMESQCTNDGSMRLTVTFKLGTDVDKAQVLVQNRVSIATPKLPEDVRRVGVTTKKQSTSIVLVVNLYSADDPKTGRPVHDQLALSNFAYLQVKDELARLPGVGDVYTLGQRDYSIRIWLDPNKMADMSLSASEVVNAVRAQNQQVASGQIGQPPAPPTQAFQIVVNTLGRLPDAETFENIIIKAGDAEQLVRLKDVARVELGARAYDTGCTIDNKPSVGLPIFQLPGANAFETAEAVHQAMARLKARFPQGMEYDIVYDPTKFVEASVNAVVRTLVEAIALVFVVVLLFLQNWRSALIPMLAVPVSLIGTFAAMAALGYSVNNLTLFGLVLAIGIVVDDAIVVVEAVEFHMARGLPPRDATRQALREVSGAVIGVALVLCAVFVPCVFIPGLTGQFFKQFAVTIAVSTLLSAFNSLTLSPALCPLLLKPHHAKRDPLQWLLDVGLGSWLFRGFNWAFDRLTAGYGRVVGLLVRLAVVVLVVYGGLLTLTYLSFRSVPGGFIPQQDQGYLVVNVQLPDGAALGRTEAVVRKATELALQTEGVGHAIGIPGYSIFAQANIPNAGGLYISLKPFDERKGLKADKIMRELNGKLAGIEEGTVMAFGAPPILGLGNAGGFKMQVQDRGNLGSGVLEGMTWNLAAAATREPGIVGTFSSFRSGAPQLFVEVDRERVQQMGIPVQAVNDTLQIYLGSLYVNDVTLFGRNFQVNVQADAAFRDTEDDIKALKVGAPNGQMVPIAGFIHIRHIDGPTKVNRYQMFPAADLNGFTIPTLISSGQAIAKMEALAKRELPQQMSFEWTDLAYQQVKAAEQEVKIPGVGSFRGDTTLLVFGLSVLFVFLVLSAQYESWLLPLAVVLVVPMCLLCAAAGLIVAKLDLNVFTQIGLVVLVGLACKNAILIVEFAKQKHEAGMGRVEAARQAATQRLRPILMTSFAFILGVLPLVVAEGAGAEMRRSLGTAVFSGMLGVTFFGVILTPVFYSVLQWIGDRRTGTKTAASEPKLPAVTVDGVVVGRANGTADGHHLDDSHPNAPADGKPLADV